MALQAVKQRAVSKTVEPARVRAIVAPATLNVILGVLVDVVAVGHRPRRVEALDLGIVRVDELEAGAHVGAGLGRDLLEDALPALVGLIRDGLVDVVLGGVLGARTPGLAHDGKT